MPVPTPFEMSRPLPAQNTLEVETAPATETPAPPCFAQAEIRRRAAASSCSRKTSLPHGGFSLNNRLRRPQRPRRYLPHLLTVPGGYVLFSRAQRKKGMSTPQQQKLGRANARLHRAPASPAKLWPACRRGRSESVANPASNNPNASLGKPQHSVSNLPRRSGAEKRFGIKIRLILYLPQ